MKTYQVWFASVLLLSAMAGCGRNSAPDPDVVVKAFSKDMAAGDMGAVWTYLPPRYQADVKGLIDDVAANLDAEVYDKGFILAGKAAKLLRTKKDFLLAAPEAPGKGPMPEMVIANLPVLTDLLESLANSEIKTHDGLKKVDLGRFLSTTGGKFFAAAKAISPIAAMPLEMLKDVKVTVVRRSGDTAMLRTELGGSPGNEEAFRLVEGKWLPQVMVDRWDGMMNQARGSLSVLKIPTEKKSEILEMMKLIDGTFDALLAAPDQAAFDKELAHARGAMAAFQMMNGGGGSTKE